MTPPRTDGNPSIMADARWSWIAHVLACPVCGQDLEVDGESPAAMKCVGCRTVFKVASDTPVLDLRCPAPKTHRLETRTGGVSYGDLLARIPVAAPTTLHTGPLPPRVMPEFISVIRDSMAPGGRIIEIGGSSGGYRRPLLDLGFRFVTTDYNAPAADLLADAHALPFKDGCAEAVLMQAASQAFENPLVAFRETARVLSEGGLLVGTADCCAVFASSFYNITPFGVLALLEASNLVLERLWILKDALEFCGTNPGYPAVVKPFLRGLSRLARLPLLTPRNLLGGRRRGALITAGSFAFVARKRQFPPA